MFGARAHRSVEVVAIPEGGGAMVTVYRVTGDGRGGLDHGPVDLEPFTETAAAAPQTDRDKLRALVAERFKMGG